MQHKERKQMTKPQPVGTFGPPEEIRVTGEFWNPCFRKTAADAIAGEPGDWLCGIVKEVTERPVAKNKDKKEFFVTFVSATAILRGQERTANDKGELIFKLTNANADIAAFFAKNVGMRYVVWFEGLLDVGKPNPMPIYKVQPDTSHTPEKVPF